MHCRHTVPDWHRYVDPAGDVVPILAGCRLLVKEGEPARDARAIACAYWGHQRDCPLFDGPGAAAKPGPQGLGRPASRDVPVVAEGVWPVRAPGARDGMRLLMLALGVASSVLMLFTLGIGLAVLSGRHAPAGYVWLMLAAVTMSIVTHVLATLRTWARR